MKFSRTNNSINDAATSTTTSIKIIKGFSHSDALRYVAENGGASKFSLIKRPNEHLYDLMFIGSRAEYEAFSNKLINDTLSPHGSIDLIIQEDQEELLQEIFGEGQLEKPVAAQQAQPQPQPQQAQPQPQPQQPQPAVTATQSTTSNSIHDLIAIRQRSELIDSTIESIKNASIPLAKRIESLEKELIEIKQNYATMQKDLQDRTTSKQECLKSEAALKQKILLNNPSPSIFTTSYQAIAYNVCVVNGEIVIDRQKNI